MSEKLLKILKTTWVRREFDNLWKQGGVMSEYIEQDSFVIPSPDGDYKEFDCVIVVTTSVLQDVAKRFSNHVSRVGDDIKTTVVYI